MIFYDGFSRFFSEFSWAILRIKKDSGPRLQGCRYPISYSEPGALPRLLFLFYRIKNKNQGAVTISPYLLGFLAPAEGCRLV